MSSSLKLRDRSNDKHLALRRYLRRASVICPTSRGVINVAALRISGFIAAVLVDLSAEQRICSRSPSMLRAKQSTVKCAFADNEAVSSKQ